jgi:hypothetical protein
MTPGVPTGALAAAAVKKAQAQILERLRKADATQPSRAVALDGLAGIQARMLTRYVAAGVVRTADHHRYFLDERKLADYEALQRERARLALLVILVIAILGLVVVGLTLATR